MKRSRFSFLLTVLLLGTILMGCLPATVFASEESTNQATATANYSTLRGSGMTADSNGVMIYNDLASYKKASQANVALATDYGTSGPNATNTGNTTTTAKYEECPALYADYAIYFDEKIEGNTVKIRYGLSMMDSVDYIDAEGNIVKGEKSPIELSAGYKNDASPNYNAGYGMVYDEDGNLEYTTQYYEEKAVLFYIINHSTSERIGQEDDVSILSDYIAQGYVVVTLDFKSHADATTPYIEMALVSARAMFDNCTSDAALKDLGVNTHGHYLYFLPEGCRLERDIWFFDTSIWGVDGTMESYLDVWDTAIADTKYDVLGIGKVSTVENMVSKITQQDGKSPIDYKLCINIIYPSQPKDGYEAPIYIQEGTMWFKEDNISNSYVKGAFAGFALNGYACVQYDTPFWPFLYRFQYNFSKGYGGQSSTNNARAAIRCARYYADELGYSKELAGASGISKATPGTSILCVKNNKAIKQAGISGYDASVFEGDILVDGQVTHTVMQPFMYYDEAHNNEISSDCTMAYISSGGGILRLFGSGMLTSYEKVPLVISGGTRDEYSCYNYWDEMVAWFDENNPSPYLPIVQLDQGHAYPVGYDNQFGYDRHAALVDYFDIYLKPDADRAPEILWATPLDGATGVAVTGKWSVGPYTPYGWELDSYYYPQAIQIRFLDAVDPDSVENGVTVTVAATGEEVEGTWVASQNDALYTFECDELATGTLFTIDISTAVKGKNGVALAEGRTVTFKTEGDHALTPVASVCVSSKAPDKVLGSTTKLQVSDDYTTLISFDTEHILDATKVQLRATALLENTVDLKVYALPDYKADASTLTYNLLTASEAWTKKIAIGTYRLVDGNVNLDLTKLSRGYELGDYVTLAIVSDDPYLSETPYVFANDFEKPPLKTALTKGSLTIVASDGSVAQDASTVAVAYSDYWWRATGGQKRAKLVNSETIPLQTGSTQAMGIQVYTGAQRMKFFNTLSNDALTEEDIGKFYRATVDVYTAQDVTLTVGVAVSASVTGGYSTFALYETQTYPVKKETWTPITYTVRVTEDMVKNQAGLLGFQCDYVEEVDDGALEMYWTYYDNLYVEECAPMFTVNLDASNNFTLITTNDPITTVASGTCGDSLTWELLSTGVLTVKGTGAMADYNIKEAPWYDYREQIDTVVISEGVTTVGKNAFYNCTSLVSVTMPDSVTKIVSNAFHTCSKLTEVTFGSGLTTIQGQAFANCRALKRITIPATVKGNMASYVFTNCSSLTDVTIEEGVTKIPNNVFNNCTSLTEITIPSTVTSIGSTSNSTFAGCTNLKSVTFLSKTTTINPASAAAIPEGATVYGFKGSTAETYVGSYKDVTGVTFVAFAEPPIASGTCGDNLKWELSADGVLTISGGGAMQTIGSAANQPWYNYCTKITSVVVLDGVTTIENSAFRDCTALTSVELSDSVTKIMANAFRGCSKLTEVSFGSGLTTLQGSSFFGCTALESITIPKTVTGIGSYAFQNCTALKNVTIEEGVKTLPNNLFHNCAGLESITLPSTITSIGSANNSTFAGCTNLKSVTFLSKTTTINPASAAAIPEGVTVYGYAGSTAAAYAEDYGRKFVDLDAPPFATDCTTALEFTVGAVKANAGEYLPLITLERIGLVDEATITFLAVDENGALYLYVEGAAEALCDAEGNAIVLAEDTPIAIIYNDETGTARFYVNRNIPCYGDEAKLAVNVPVADDAFLAIGAVSEELTVAEGVTCDNTVTTSDQPAEFAGFQASLTDDTELRILAGINMLYYDNIGFEISLYSNGNLQGTVTKTTSTVFTSLLADGETVTAESLGHNYLTAVKITGIDRTEYPSDCIVYFTVKTFTTIGEEKLYGAEKTIYITHDTKKHQYSTEEPLNASAVLLELTEKAATAGGDYSDFYVYTRTSDASGRYYVRYGFGYVYSTATTNGTNSATNIDSFRISSAHLVKLSEVSETAVSYSVISNLLNAGEISLAIREYRFDESAQANAVKDFCGGWHGDEHITSFALAADGVSYVPGAENKIVQCSTVTIDQVTTLDRWAAVAGSAGQFAEHTQNFEITADGMFIDRTVEWLVGDFVVDAAYPMMYTLLRLYSGNAVCEIVETFDENGNSLGKEVLDLHNTTAQTDVLKNAALRTVKFSSATSGISSEAGFTLGKNNDGVLGTPYIAYRLDGAGDNKLYIPMKGSANVTVPTASGTTTKTQPAVGDTWEISCFYKIDYVNPAN